MEFVANQTGSSPFRPRAPAIPERRVKKAVRDSFDPMKRKIIFSRLAGCLSGAGLWLALSLTSASGQANYATPFTFTTVAGCAGSGVADGTAGDARFYRVQAR